MVEALSQHAAEQSEAAASRGVRFGERPYFERRHHHHQREGQGKQEEEPQ